MQIRQGPEHDSLELRSGTGGGLKVVVGIAVAVIGLAFGVTAFSTVFVTFRASPNLPTPWVFLIVPVFFVIIGLIFIGGGTRIRTLLR